MELLHTLTVYSINHLPMNTNSNTPLMPTSSTTNAP